MASRDVRTRLARRASKAGLTLRDEALARLTDYFDLLERWNRKINLTALDDPDAAIDRLLLEPALAARVLPSAPQLALIDLGSGGGSPAIPLAICSDSPVQLTMVEVKTRKSAFLREAVRQLQLTATVENSRFEELLARVDLHERFDLASVRAVRVENSLMRTVQAFLKTGGKVLLFRGPSGADRPSVTPPLTWESTVPLVEALRSRLTILRKQGAPASVPRA